MAFLRTLFGGSVLGPVNRVTEGLSAFDGSIVSLISLDCGDGLRCLHAGIGMGNGSGGGLSTGAPGNSGTGREAMTALALLDVSSFPLVADLSADFSP